MTYYAGGLCTHISKLSLSYYMLKNDLKLLVAYNNKDYILLNYISSAGQLQPGFTLLLPEI